ncbi:hypothetical protein F5148DRAFT_1235440, partial [Russula earlei]
MTTDDSVWSFNLRSYNPRDFSDSDSDDNLLDNPCSDGSTLVDHPMSEDNDTAVFRPNPWTIAKINAASRAAYTYALRFLDPIADLDSRVRRQWNLRFPNQSRLRFQQKS